MFLLFDKSKTKQKLLQRFALRAEVYFFSESTQLCRHCEKILQGKIFVAIYLSDFLWILRIKAQYDGIRQISLFPKYALKNIIHIF